MLPQIKTMYRLMAERHAASPYTQHQAAVYRDILALIDECDSVSTVIRRMQAEGYNTKPTLALTKDKLTAHLQAAIDNELADHAEIYRKVLDHLQENPEDAYLTGYYSDVKQANIRYAQTLGRLLNCFNDFLYYEVKKEVLPNVKRQYEEWKKEGKSLSEIVKIKVLRNHFACSDAYLQHFVNEYENFILLASSNKEQALGTPMQAEFEQAWSEIKHKNRERRTMAQSELPKFRRAIAMSIPPTSETGNYEYINVEFENYI